MAHLEHICQHCPVEKSHEGPCFDGLWEQNETGTWHFHGIWKCTLYCPNKRRCQCSCCVEEEHIEMTE